MLSCIFVCGRFSNLLQLRLPSPAPNRVQNHRSPFVVTVCCKNYPNHQLAYRRARTKTKGTTGKISNFYVAMAFRQELNGDILRQNFKSFTNSRSCTIQFALERQKKDISKGFFDFIVAFRTKNGHIFRSNFKGFGFRSWSILGSPFACNTIYTDK